MTSFEEVKPIDTFNIEVFTDAQPGNALGEKVERMIYVMKSLQFINEISATVLEREERLIRYMFGIFKDEVEQIRDDIQPLADEVDEFSLFGGDVLDLSGLRNTHFDADVDFLSPLIDGMPASSYLLDPPRMIAIQANSGMLLASQTVHEKWQCGKSGILAGEMGYILDPNNDHSQVVEAQLYPFGLEDVIVDGMAAKLFQS